MAYTLFKNLGGNIEIENESNDINSIKFKVWNIIKNNEYNKEPKYEDLQIKIIKEIE